MEEILKNKTAVVYGAGSIGGAVAAAFAKAGATVFVADHHEDTLKKLADQQIQTERLDVLWQRAIQAGAEVFHSLEDAFWGDRHGQIIDPFGHRWGLASMCVMSHQRK